MRQTLNSRSELIRALLSVVIGALIALLIFGDSSTNPVESSAVDVAVDTATATPCDRDMQQYDSETLRTLIADAESQLQQRSNLREAWAFVLDHDDAQRHYATAILAHIRAIRQWSFVRRPIVLLVNERMSLARDAKSTQVFRDEGVTVQSFHDIVYDKSRLLVLKNVNRLHLWQLPFDRVVFVAPEVALIRNLEYLFQYPDFAVVPNSETPDQFRTSLMVLRPNADTFAALLQSLKSYEPTWDTSEQAFLANFFNNTQTLLPWSSCPSVRALYMRPELWDFRDITCLHWSQFQPWTWQKRTDLLHLLFHWYDYLARYVPEFEIPRDDYAPDWPRKKKKSKKNN